MSSPLKRIEPSVISYSGLPSNTLASVDLPEPLGPNSAWISPGATVRSTPRRIGVEPALACRLRTSKSGLMAPSLCNRDRHLHYAGSGNYRAAAIAERAELVRRPGGLVSTPESGRGGHRSDPRPRPTRRGAGGRSRGGEVVAVDREVAGVGLDRGPGAPQQPTADAALVHGDLELRVGVAEVVTQRQQRGGCLDPRGGGDVAVAGRACRAVRPCAAACCR